MPQCYRRFHCFGARSSAGEGRSDQPPRRPLSAPSFISGHALLPLITACNKQAAFAAFLLSYRDVQLAGSASAGGGEIQGGRAGILRRAKFRIVVLLNIRSSHHSPPVRLI